MAAREVDSNELVAAMWAKPYLGAWAEVFYFFSRRARPESVSLAEAGIPMLMECCGQNCAGFLSWIPSCFFAAKRFAVQMGFEHVLTIPDALYVARKKKTVTGELFRLKNNKFKR